MFDEIVETGLYALALPFHGFISTIASTELSNRFAYVPAKYYATIRRKAPLLLAFLALRVCWHGLCSYIPAKLKSKVI